MHISLIAFIISGFLIVVFIGIKVIQQHIGYLLFWPATREGVEDKLQSIRQKGERFISGFNRRTALILLHSVLSKIRNIFVYIQHVIDKRLVYLVNLIKGKQTGEKTRGRASHFLYDIKHFKDKFKRTK
jgi:hypothetical protein